MLIPYSKLIARLACTVMLVASIAGCAQLRVPQIDPMGRTIFLPAPNSTQILTPGLSRGAVPSTPMVQAPAGFQSVPGNIPPVQGIQSDPAFTPPPRVPSCANGQCGARLHNPQIQPAGSLVSHRVPSSRNKRGTLTTTPARIVAPVGSEVVVLAGICGDDGYYITNQPIEWMLSQDSAGQIIEVGGMEHSTLNRLLPPSSKKMSGVYAHGRTGLKEKLLTRGTETCVDDQKVARGQTYITLTSGSEGTSYLTTVAPRTDAWPERKSITRIHWVDGIWSIPMPSSAAAGTVHPLNTLVTRTSDGTGVNGWIVKYQIVGGVAAEFGPAGTQTAEVTTNSQGRAPVNLRQPAGKAVVGPTQVRVEVIRPGYGGGREITLESGITTVNWSAPALTIRAIGPRTAGVNQPFNYRIEVTNPGDRVARNVIVSSNDFIDSVEYISSSPKPGQYGSRFEWNIGDVQPGSLPRIIDIQLRSSEKGPKQICFEVASASDQLKTETCTETTIAVPCIDLSIEGPTHAKVGDSVRYNFNITNQCDRPLENVQIRIQYDTGLSAEGVANPAELTPIARILPGETVNLPALTFRPLRGGTHCFNLEINSAAGDTSRARRCLEVENVTQSRVRIDMESQGVVRVGDQVLVKMKVTNVGNVPLDEVTLINTFSRSLTPVQRTALPQTWIGDDMAFQLGRLEAGQQRVVEVRYNTNRADGDAFSRATVTTPLGASDQTGVTIRIETNAPGGTNAPTLSEPGIAIPDDPAGSLSISVIAIDRTVAVNNNARFQISVTNNRSVTDQNIVISLLVPPGTRLLAPDPSQTGLRIGTPSADGSQIQFEPRREMRAGETLTFPIALQTLQTGQSTLVARATSVRTPNTIEASGSVTVVP